MAKKKRKAARGQETLMDMVRALQDVMQDYSITMRKKAWKKLSSKDGKKEMEKLLINPSRSISKFRSLWGKSFKEWLIDP